MSRDVPRLPWTELTKLWFVAALRAGCIAASAVYGVIGSLIRGWPEQTTSDGAHDAR